MPGLRTAGRGVGNGERHPGGAVLDEQGVEIGLRLCREIRRRERGSLAGHGERGRVERRLQRGLDRVGAAVVDGSADQAQHRNESEPEHRQDVAAAVGEEPHDLTRHHLTLLRPAFFARDRCVIGSDDSEDVFKDGGCNRLKSAASH